MCAGNVYSVVFSTLAVSLKSFERTVKSTFFVEALPLRD